MLIYRIPFITYIISFVLQFELHHDGFLIIGSFQFTRPYLK